MDDKYRAKLENLVKEKKYLELQGFKNIITFIGRNCVSDQLLDIFLEYLKIYPQQIFLIPKKLFIQLLSNSGKSLHPLVLFLASQHDYIDYDLNLDNLPEEKWSYLMSAFYEKFPLMTCDPIIVLKIKNKIDTYKMLIDSPQWFNENGDFFMGLHAIEFDEDECDELFTKLKTNWSIFKITKAAVSFVDLVASKCNKESEFIQFLISTLFSLPPENENVDWLSNQIINNFKLLETLSPLEISDWDALTIKAVKCGLIENDPEYGFIRVFRKLIKKANIDKSVVSKSFELLAGYSQFTNIMLNRDAKQIQKEEVLRLIFTLVKKEPSIMALSHIPLFLCSYNASLSVTDQILLKILAYYEENNIPMSNYRPYLWGSFAVSHYQVKNHLTSKTLHSFPSTTEVLSYIPFKRLKETISCFPVNRSLCVKNEKIIRYNPSNSQDPSKMFDPSFFLPMISSLLATEAPLSIEKFNTSGCLSMVLVCLGSCDCSMRAAAYHVLTLLRSHLFCRRAENMFWDYFLSWVAHGIQHLHLQPPPQLPMISAMFLSRMVLAMANHEKAVEATCAKVLLARPVAQLNYVPELKKFLTAMLPIKDKSLSMIWVFEIIRDGIHTNSDWNTLRLMDIFNIILFMFRSSNEKFKVLVLKIMESLFRVQPATKGGTGPWAISIMIAVDKCPSKLSPEVIIGTFRCLQSLTNSSFISIFVVDFWLSIFLKYGENADICSEGYITLNSLISKYKNVFQLFNNENLEEIIDRGAESKVLSDDEVFKCRSVLLYGIKGIKIKEPNPYLLLPVLVKILKAE
ncbi:nucleolar pre-ribosomal-associated protein 1 [Sipha flava]|uniref:Nucleolar pre-ribosomal-associated protein 1 n=2 Tax=Sipha flava TaxID=143950 RepID=A0A8B8FQY5_9HEMI|nr:nucleolar pre-ribosomal-associated protein 1 [Sipha flava]